jgi:RNA polymerase sigma-70 factor (ECF subfamily)
VAELEILMLAYQRGDQAATTDLVRQVSSLLLRFFASQDNSRPQAEDLLQDTWLQIHEARHTHRPGEPVLPWIYAIARHARVDGHRCSQRIRAREGSISTLPEPTQSARPLPARAPDFDAPIAVLPPSQREVVSMLKVSGMSLEEVARATASSVGSVKLKAHRAHEKLRAVVKRQGSGSALRIGDDVV